jgi:hypothetical protein
MTWPAIEDDIRRERDAGVVTTATVPRPPALGTQACADVVASRVGYRALGHGWLALSDAEAEAVLHLVLTQDLAHHREVMAAATASTLIGRFLGYLGEGADFVTNGTWAVPPLGVAKGVRSGPSWIPITKATFDAGIVGVGRECVAMIWVEDED